MIYHTKSCDLFIAEGLFKTSILVHLERVVLIALSKSRLITVCFVQTGKPQVVFEIAFFVMIG